MLRARERGNPDLFRLAHIKDRNRVAAIEPRA
jgi:hypothetical protein